MRILQLVLHIKQNRVEAGVLDPSGKVRRVVVQGFAKERTSLLPPAWRSSLEGEVRFAMGVDKAKADGRWIPG